MIEQLQALWAKHHNDPVFVTATSLFLGALAKEIYTALQTGGVDLSVTSLKQMAAAAIGTTAVALYHLYIVPRNPTLAAAIRTSPVAICSTCGEGGTATGSIALSSQVEQVATELKPIDPAAVPVKEQP